MSAPTQISFGHIFRRFWRGIVVTWAIVLCENLALAFIPLLIGLSIDGLLQQSFDELIVLGATLLALGVIAVGRRVYDTRMYGSIRLHLGDMLDRQSAQLPVSTRAARLGMSRELVDFLEETAPELITAVIQVTVSFAVLLWFGLGLGVAAAAALLAMLAVYALFHRAFYRLNAALNSEAEKRVALLSEGARLGVFKHLRAIRATEVALSDQEAMLYGGIFALQIAFILVNLVQGAQLPGVTAGMIFSIATYSWEFVEAALLLPIALQGWSRLSEILKRLNELS